MAVGAYIRDIMCEEIEPERDLLKDGLHIPESQKHRGFKNLHIDNFISSLKRHGEDCDCNNENEE